MYTEAKDITQIGGTGLKATIDTSYEILIRVFGEPTGITDKYKSDIVWEVQTPYGIACIYNYADGRSHLGEKGKDVKDITDWNIGAHNLETAEFIIKAINISTDIITINNKWLSFSLEELQERHVDIENEFNEILRDKNLENQEDKLEDKLDELGEVQVAIARAE